MFGSAYMMMQTIGNDMLEWDSVSVPKKQPCQNLSLFLSFSFKGSYQNLSKRTTEVKGES